MLIQHEGARGYPNQRAITIWLTGLSGSGKSTLAYALENHFLKVGNSCYVLDGDVLRSGLNSDLGYGDKDRSENIRRVAEVAKILNAAGVFVIVALISPFKDDRYRAQKIIGADKFLEIHLNAPISICESRDPKGLYKKARAGLLQQFTGIDSVYEAPVNPNLKIDSSQLTIEQSVSNVINFLSKLES